jgi:hypothetical protein
MLTAESGLSTSCATLPANCQFLRPAPGEVLVLLLRAVDLPHRPDGGGGGQGGDERAEGVELPGDAVAARQPRLDLPGRRLGGADVVLHQSVGGRASLVRGVGDLGPQRLQRLRPVAAAGLLQGPLRGLVEGAHRAVQPSQQHGLRGIGGQGDRLLQQLVDAVAGLGHLLGRGVQLHGAEDARLQLADLRAQVAHHLDPWTDVAGDPRRLLVDLLRLVLHQDGRSDESGDHRHEGRHQDAG